MASFAFQNAVFRVAVCRLLARRLPSLGASVVFIIRELTFVLKFFLA